MKATIEHPPDLSTLGAGFSDVAHGSQSVFRSVLHAFSHPGRKVTITSDAEVPPQLVASGQAGAASVLLALLDAQTSLWLSPTVSASGVETWLRFHTGCVVVSDPARAQFVWAASLAELPGLTALDLGTDASPELAATCVIGVPSIDPDLPSGGQLASGQAVWSLQGPGIAQTHTLHIGGLSATERDSFQAWHQANHAVFPRGVDVVLTSDTHLCGLPRTTRLTPLFRPLAAQGD